ncbi:MAG: hypothetical protein AAF491_00210 [Verrucomicrobiota bacterium]
MWIAALAIIVILGLRRALEWNGNEVWAVLTLFGLWLLAGGLIITARRPGIADSLLTLDREGGWNDRFTSAWEFSKREDPTEAEKLHIRKSTKEIEEATTVFPRSVPLPDLRFFWILPLLAISLAFAPFGRVAPKAGDLILTAEMRATAEEQATELKKSLEQVDGLESLNEAEVEELEDLRVQVESMADTLENAEGLTAGEMLDALESRARAAERLAEKMGLGEDSWASEEMLAEMATHPDSAELSLAIKDKAALAAAMETERLQKILEQPEITRETIDRITDALDQIIAAALDSDYNKPVGERFGNASTKMFQKQAITAAREFEELAKHFRFLLSREEAREKLEELATSLRDAGSEVSGSELEQMERIANENRSGSGVPEGLQSINEGAMPKDLEKMLAPQMAQSGAGQSPSGSFSPSEGNPSEEQRPQAPVPGEPADGNGEASGEGQTMAMEAPIPGQPQEPGNGQSGFGSDRSQASEDGGGTLSAPVPGEEPGESGQAGDLAMAGGSGAQTGLGGDQAGTGTAPLVDSESEFIQPAGDSEVIAQINEDGNSTVRAVQGSARPENATRSRQEILTDFIAAEEQALDGKEIPLSRREHIIRYFSEIRRQFESAKEAP